MLLVLLGSGAAGLSLWCAWDVWRTDPYLVPWRSRRRWLLIALVPLIGPAHWLEVGRPPPGDGPIVCQSVPD